MSAIDRIRETDNNYDLTLEGEAILELSDSIQALTERVDELEDIGKRYEQLEIFCFNKYLEDQPVPNMPEPVLNDRKATSNPGGQLPFVTGLSVEKPTKEELVEKYYKKWTTCEVTLATYESTVKQMMLNLLNEGSQGSQGSQGS